MVMAGEMIEKPQGGKYTAMADELWEIAILVETMGGDKSKAFQINKILDAIVERRGGMWVK